MPRWSTSSTFEAAGVTAGAVWERAYADAPAWPRWNGALASAEPEGPFEAGTRVRVRFRTGLRLRFTLTEVEAECVFTDESRLPGATMGHRHELEPTSDGVRLDNTIYIEGPLALVWGAVLGPPAKRGLPGWQRAIADLARA